MRSGCERMRRAVARTLVGLTLVALAAVALAPAAARAEPMTFQLTVADALGSVDHYNAFLTALGKRAHGLKVIPGGTTFAGQSCAALGTVFRLGSVAVLDGTAALAARAPSRDGKIAAALTGVFTAAGVQTWTPPVIEADTDL